MSATRFTPVRLDPAHPVASPASLTRRLLPAAAGPRMRALLVLSSEPVDLGEETELFELTARLTERVAYTIRIDAGDPTNVALTHAFAARLGIAVEVGSADDLAPLLAGTAWDLVEVAGWVDPAVNAQILRTIGDRTLVIANEGTVDPALIRRADAVLCASPEERRRIQVEVAPGRNHCYHLPDDTDWDSRAVQKWQILAGTWFTRHYLDRPFQGPRPVAPSLRVG